MANFDPPVNSVSQNGCAKNCAMLTKFTVGLIQSDSTALKHKVVLCGFFLSVKFATPYSLHLQGNKSQKL